MEHAEYVVIEGKKVQRSRHFRMILVGLGNSLLSSFLFLTKMGFQGPIKYLLSSASIPLEVINLIAQFKNLWDKQKPFWLFFMVGAISIGSMCLLVITDIVKWMGWTTGVLATIAASGMIFFTCVMSLYMALNLVSFIRTAKMFYQNPHCRTPLQKVSLVTKATKTVCFAVLGALMIPFSLALAANPVGATILISVMTAVLLAVIVVKIAKTIRENKGWKKTIAETKQDAYEMLGVDRAVLQALIKKERKHKEPFWVTLKDNIQKGWLSLFGTEEQKKVIEESKKNTVTRYIQNCYEYTLMPAKKDVDSLEEKMREHQKNLSIHYKDVIAGAWWQEMISITTELKKAREQYQIQKQNVHCHPRLIELQNVYDLLRKPRGRLKYEETMKKQHAREIAAIEQQGMVEQENEREHLIEQALEEPQYLQIYQGERISHYHEIKSASMPILKPKHRESLLNLG